ncbi:MAG: App1 family protein [Verrucomicrobiota bacterium]
MTFGRVLFCVTLALLMSNPLLAQTSNLKRDEAVILFPTLAWQESNSWHAEMHAWVFEPEKRALSLGAIRKVLGLVEEDTTPEEEAIFKERALWFLVDNERTKRVVVRAADKVYQLPPTEANGHTWGATILGGTDVLKWTALAGANGGAVPLEVILPESDGRRVNGEIHVVEPAGLSVISDIDDTIKVSEVRDRKALLRNTFYRPFKAVDGMSAMYRRWAETRQARFHYVSASPWQLYPALAEFRAAEGFPAGTFHLKDFRVKDRTALALFDSPVEYKLGVIEPLLQRFPERRFVLVGDSGEKDPEVYGEIARRHPQQVVVILIRDVTGEGRDAQRYVDAFRSVAADRWRIFAEPREVLDALEQRNLPDRGCPQPQRVD